MSSIRKPLSSKDANLRSTPSPIKTPRRALSSTPAFTIYADDTDYRTQQGSDTRLDADNKENVTVRHRVHSPSKESPRKHRRERSLTKMPLQDLDIRMYPGYIQYHSDLDPNGGILQPKTQLTNSWILKFDSEGKRIRIPSYLTPPRKNRVLDIQYVSSLDDARIDTVLRKRRSSSLSAAPVITPRRLDFQIYQD